MNVPQHIAIILDETDAGQIRRMPRNYGHAQGAKNVEKICEEAWRGGIKYRQSMHFLRKLEQTTE